MEVKTLKDSQDARGRIREVAETLLNLAFSFSCTGNQYVADKLQKYSELLEEDCAILSKAEGEMVSSYVNEIHQATHNMVEAAIAAATANKLNGEQK